MATVTKTIGSDAARDYSTITAWEADDGGGDGLGNDDCTGNCYNDSAFDEAVTIDFSANSITLTVPEAERHDGTAGTGARIVLSSKSTRHTILCQAPSITVSWLEVDDNGQSKVSTPAYGLAAVDAAGNDGTFSWEQLIVHGVRGDSSFSSAFHHAQHDPGNHDILNCVGYDIDSPANRDAHGVYARVARSTRILNVTIHDVHTNSSGDPAYCFQFLNDADYQIQNCLGTDPVNDSSGGQACFEPSDGNAGSCTAASHNASSDATAPDDSDAGTALHNITTADQYVSTSPVDLHLKSGADCIDAGTDLGTTPSGVEIDIDGRDRDAEGDTWDIGGDEYESLTQVSIPVIQHHRQQQGVAA